MQDITDYLTGIWVGTLTIPNVAELRMGTTVARNPDGTVRAALRIIDQNTGDIPCDEVVAEKSTIRIRIAHLGIEIEGKADLEHHTITGEFRQRGAVFPIVFARVDSMPVLKRPQEPTRPYPYHEQQVEYENKRAGVTLGATFTYPRSSGGPFPAVILLTGSGSLDRDESAYGHRPFLVLADYLTRQGIAVLRADDRGVGSSTGNASQSTTGDLADDALAGVDYLKSRKEVNPRLIGLAGHSEGTMKAAIAANRSADVAFIVLMAGLGIGFDEAVTFQVLEQLRLQGVSEADMALQRSWRSSLYSLFKQGLDARAIESRMRELYAGLSEEEKERLNWPQERLEFEIKRSLSPWWHYALAYDPRETLLGVRCPVLAINGDKDTQTPSKMNLPPIQEALEAGGNTRVWVKELPGLNHLFQRAETGSEYEYGRIEETMSPDALKLIAGWILDRARATVQ